MAAAFDVNAVLRVKGPANIGPVVSSLRRQLEGLNADIGPRVSPGTRGDIAALNAQAKRLGDGLRATRAEASGLARSMAGLGNSGRRIAAAQNGLVGVSQGAKAAGSGLAGATSNAEAFGRSMGTVIRRFGEFYAVVRVFDAVRSSFEEGAKEAVKFQHEMVRLSQIGGTTARDIGDIKREITGLATSLGVSSRELSTVATTLRQADFAGQQVVDTLAAIAKTTLAPTFESIQNTTEGVIAMKQQFGVAARDIEGYLGSINTVSGALAVESEDLVTAIRKTGGAFKAASGDMQGSKESFNQLLALFSSVRSTTRESADEISTGLRTIFGRLQSGQVTENLKQMGISLRYTAEEAASLGKTDLKGQFVGAYEAVRRLSAATKNLSGTDPRFSRIVTEIGGYRQISRVIPLLQQFATAERAYAIAQAGANSLTLDAAKAQESFQVRLAKTKENFFDLIRTVGDNKGFQKLIDLGLKMADAFVEVGKALTPLIPAIAALAASKLIANTAAIPRNILAGARATATTFPTAPVRRQSGGVVPGHGRGDKVPIRGREGDYVIRRSSALEIGHANLDRLAKGGVDVLAEPGEHYFTRDEAAKIGYPRLDAMNRTGRAPGTHPMLAEPDFSRSGNPTSDRLYWKLHRKAETRRKLASARAGRDISASDFLGGRYAEGGKVEYDHGADARIAAYARAFGVGPGALASQLGIQKTRGVANKKAGDLFPQIQALASARGVDISGVSSRKTGRAGSQIRDDDAAAVHRALAGDLSDPVLGSAAGSLSGLGHQKEFERELKGYFGQNVHNPKTGRSKFQPGLLHAASVDPKTGQVDREKYRRYQRQLLVASQVIRNEKGFSGTSDRFDYQAYLDASGHGHNKGSTGQLAAIPLASSHDDPFERAHQNVGSNRPAPFIGPANRPTQGLGQDELDAIGRGQGGSASARTGLGIGRVRNRQVAPPATLAPVAVDASPARSIDDIHAVARNAEESSIRAAELGRSRQAVVSTRASAADSFFGGLKYGGRRSPHYDPQPWPNQASGAVDFYSPYTPPAPGPVAPPSAGSGRRGRPPGSKNRVAAPGGDGDGGLGSNPEIIALLKQIAAAIRDGSRPLKDAARKIDKAATRDPNGPARGQRSFGFLGPKRTIGGSKDSEEVLREQEARGRPLKGQGGLFPESAPVSITLPTRAAPARKYRKTVVPVGLDERTAAGRLGRPEGAYDRSPLFDPKAGGGAYGITPTDNHSHPLIGPSELPVAAYRRGSGPGEAYGLGVIPGRRGRPDGRLPIDLATGDEFARSISDPFTTRTPLVPPDLGGRGARRGRFQPPSGEADNIHQAGGINPGAYRRHPAGYAARRRELDGLGLGNSSITDRQLDHASLYNHPVRGEFRAHTHLDDFLSKVDDTAESVRIAGDGSSYDLDGPHKSDRRKKLEARVEARRRRSRVGLNPLDRLRGRSVVAGRQLQDLPDAHRRRILDQAEARYGDDPGLVDAVRGGRSDVVLTKTGGLVSATDRRAPRPSALGRLASQAAAIGNVDVTGRGKDGSAGRRLVGRLGGATQTAGYAGLLLGAYAPDLLQQHFGSLEAPKGSRDDAKHAAAAGGALQLGSVGFQLGSAIHPLVGAFAGLGLAAYGYLNALKEAENRLKEIDFEKGFAKLQFAINNIAEGNIAPSKAALTQVNGGIQASLAEAGRRTEAEGGGGNFLHRNLGGTRIGRGLDRLTGAVGSLLGGSGTGALGDATEREQDAATIRQQKSAEILSPQLPALQQIATRLAEQVAQKQVRAGSQDVRTTADPAQLAARRKNRLASFDEAGGGQIAEAIAYVQKIPVSQVREQFDRLIVSSAQLKIQQEGLAKGDALAAIQVQKYGRLAQAVDAASLSLHELQGASDTISGLFDGHANAPKLSRFSAAAGTIGGIDREGFDRSTRFTRASLGGRGGELGEGFARTLSEIDGLLRTLPQAITDASSRSSEDSVSGDISKVLEGVPKDLRPQLGAAIDSIDPKDLHRRAGEDPDKLARDLIEHAFGHLTKASEDVARKLEAGFNAFGDGLQRAAEMANAFGETLDRQSTQGLAVARASAGLSSIRSGRGAENFVSLARLRNPFNARQSRLAGPNVANAFDAAEIGRRYAAIRPGIDAQRSIIDSPDATTDARKAAGEQFARLSSEAGNLMKALENLANTSEEAASIQEKSNEAEKERAGQLSATERLLTSSPQELRRAHQSAGLADVAARQGSFAGLNAQQVGGALEHLRGLQDVKLPGYGNRTGGEVSESLLDDARRRIGFGGRAGAVDGQRLGLAGQQKGVEDRGAAAIAEIGKIQERLNADFLANLRQQSGVFLDRMGQLLAASLHRDAEGDVQRARFAVGHAEQAKGTVARLDRDYGTGAGDNGLDRARKAMANPALGELKGTLGEIDTIRSRSKSFRGQGGLFDQVAAGFSSGSLFGRQVDPPKKGDTWEEYVPRHREQVFSAAPALADRTGLSREDVEKNILAPYMAAFPEANKKGESSGSLLSRHIEKGVGIKSGDLAGRQKYLAEDVGGTAYGTTAPDGDIRSKIDGLARGLDDVDRQLKGLDGIKSLDDAGQRLASAEDVLNRAMLAKARTLEAARAPTSPPPTNPVARAIGGPVSGPDGPDQIPARLSNGEYVVRRAQARKNRDILDRINRGEEVPGSVDAIRKEGQRRARAAIDRRTATATRPVDLAEVRRKGKIADDSAYAKHYAILQSIGKGGRAAEIAQQREATGGVEFQEAPSPRRLAARARIAAEQQARTAGIAARAGARRARVLRQRRGDKHAGQLPGFVGPTSAPSPGRRGRSNPAAYFVALDNMGYYADGGFVPRDSDSKPAMLTPDEFVVNAEAAKANAPALRAINSGTGPVSSGAGSGSGQGQGGGISAGTIEALGAFSKSFRSAVSEFQAPVAQLRSAAEGMAKFGEAAGSLAGGFASFAAPARALADGLASFAEAAKLLSAVNIPSTIQVQTNGRFEVLINGAQVIAAIKGDLAREVGSQVMEALGREIEKHIKDMPVRN